jgi:hypothetical protein
VLLPFDIRPDRLGWSVIEVATDRAASLDGVMLIGLSIEDAEQLVNGFNALELRCNSLARQSVLRDLRIAPQLSASECWPINSPPRTTRPWL